MSRSKPVTPLEVALLAVYVLFAVGRQAARDARTIIDWARWPSSKPR